MRYHLFQKVFGKMVKIKETSFFLSKCLVSIARHCRKTEDVSINDVALIFFVGCQRKSELLQKNVLNLLFSV